MDLNVVIAIALCMVLTACGGGSSGLGEASDATVGSPTSASEPNESDTTAAASELGTFQLDWIKNVQFAGYFYAADAGLYQEAGVTPPTFEARAGSTDPINIVVSGAADFGITSGQDAVTARSRDIPIVVFGALFQKSPGALVSLEEKGITQPEDLIGKRIGIQQTARTSILSLLEESGISEDEVTLVTVGDDPSVLVRDQVDVLTSFATNQPVFLRSEGYEVNVMSYSDLGREEYSGVLFTTESTYEEHKDDLVRFMEASRNGWNYTFDNIPEVTELVVEDFGEGLQVEEQVLELEAMQPLIATSETEANGLFTMSMDVWEGTQDGLIAADQIDDQIALEDLVKLDILEAAD